MTQINDEDLPIILKPVIEVFGPHKRLDKIKVVQAPAFIKFHVFGNEVGGTGEEFQDPDMLRMLIANGHAFTMQEAEEVPISAEAMAYRRNESWVIHNPWIEG